MKIRRATKQEKKRFAELTAKLTALMADEDRKMISLPTGPIDDVYRNELPIVSKEVKKPTQEQARTQVELSRAMIGKAGELLSEAARERSVVVVSESEMPSHDSTTMDLAKVCSHPSAFELGEIQAIQRVGDYTLVTFLDDAKRTRFTSYCDSQWTCVVDLTLEKALVRAMATNFCEAEDVPAIVRIMTLLLQR